MSQLLNPFEQRISLPDDPEPVRRQKLIAFVAALGALTSSFLFTAIFFAADLNAIGWINLIYTLTFVFFTAIGLLQPRLFPVMAMGIGIISVVANFVSHGLSGGFHGGMWFLGWAIVVPLNMFLANGTRAGVAAFVLCLCAFMTAAFLEPVFAASTMVIPHTLRVIFNTLVIIATTTLGFVWSLYFVKELDAARARADDLLLNILPAPIAGRLKKDTSTIADGFDEVTVLFADIVNFTQLSAETDPVEVVAFLNTIFSEFDVLAERHGLEKIKTIGDAYMVAGGLPIPRPDHCEAVVAFAIDMLAACKNHTAWHGKPVRLRVGVNTGPVVAGVIGRRKFIYDLWGDAVNTASRMESNGVVDGIQVTAAVSVFTNEVYSVPIAGGEAIRLNDSLVGGGSVLSFAVSPDSSRVVYHADQEVDADFELYSVPITGGDVTKLNAPLVAEGDVTAYAISPDSSAVVYRADQEEDELFNIYSVPLTGGQSSMVNAWSDVRGSVASFRISPDSNRVVYRADQEVVDKIELFVTFDDGVLPRTDIYLPVILAQSE